jgi:hypothetical protein
LALTGIKTSNYSQQDFHHLRSVEPAVLKSQAIPAARDLWNVNRSSGFWAKRQELLAEAFNGYLKAAFARRRAIG